MILQKSFSYADLLLKKHFWLLSIMKTVKLLNIIVESSKEQHLYEIEIFCNIINVFSVTFHQFNASLLSKSVN